MKKNKRWEPRTLATKWQLFKARIGEALCKAGFHSLDSKPVSSSPYLMQCYVCKRCGKIINLGI